MPDAMVALAPARPDPAEAVIYLDPDGRLHLPYVTMRRRRGDQWQFVYIVGTIHVGPAPFYRAIMTRIEQWQAQQPTLILSEGPKVTNPPTDLELAFVGSVDGADLLEPALRSAGYSDLTTQFDVLQAGPTWFNADMTIAALADAIGFTGAEDDTPEQELPSLDQIADYIEGGFGEANSVFLDMREEHLCQIVDAIFDHRVPASASFASENIFAVALPWGALHVRGIRARLEQQGFEVRQRFWVSLADGSIHRHTDTWAER
jgi:hypothetical protein